jgi:hypothetical protein
MKNERKSNPQLKKGDWSTNSLIVEIRRSRCKNLENSQLLVRSKLGTGIQVPVQLHLLRLQTVPKVRPRRRAYSSTE